MDEKQIGERSLVGPYFEQRISRRTALMVIGGTVAGALAAACEGPTRSTGTPSPTTTGVPSPSDLSELIYADVYPTLPPKGGRLEIGIAEQVASTLDVYTDAAGAAFWAADPAHDYLEHYDHTVTLHPEIAEAVEVVDAQTVRYTLHEGATFHDGAPVTADEIKKTFEWAQDPDNGAVFGSFFEGVVFKALDARTLEFRLPKPDATFRAKLLNFPIVPVDSMAQQSERVIGAGPFIFEEWVKDSHVEYRANADYWNPDAPRLDSLRIRFFPDKLSALQTFLGGELDYLTSVPLAEVPSLREREAQGEFKMAVKETGVMYIAMNLKESPYDDPRVRQAIRLAVNREQMVETAFFGESRPLYFLGILPENQFYPADLEYEQDVDEAKRLMAEAGYADGFSDTFLTTDFDYFQSLSAVIQAQLGEIGIKLELEVVDLETLIARSFEEKRFTILLLGAALDPEPSNRVDRYVHTGEGGNYTNYSNPAADALMDEAKRTLDAAGRKALYEQVLQKVFIEDAPVVPLCVEPFVDVYRPHTNGEQYSVQVDRWHYPIAATTKP